MFLTKFNDLSAEDFDNTKLNFTIVVFGNKRYTCTKHLVKAKINGSAKFIFHTLKVKFTIVLLGD